jgi:hypothetical protein
MPRRISVDGPRRSLWQIESHPVAVEGPGHDAARRSAVPASRAQPKGMRRVIRPAAGLSRDIPAARSSRPTIRSRFGRGSRPIRCGPAPMGRAIASPPAPTLTRIRKPTACPNGWLQNVRSMVAISCSGTRSASGMCRGPKTGRRCRGSGTASGCGRSISLTEIRRLTYHRSMRRSNEAAADNAGNGVRFVVRGGDVARWRRGRKRG